MSEADAQRSSAAGSIAERREDSLMNLAMKRSWVATLDIAASYARQEEKPQHRISPR